MKILRDESGQAMAFMALFLGMLMLGFLALALDVGYLFHEKRMAQAAADAAAVAAAEEASYGTSAQTNAADAIAKLNGFDTTLATNPASVTIGTPTSGNYAGTSYVQATVSEPIQTFFLGAFNRGSPTLTVAASAVAAAGQTSPTCICLEGQTGQDLNMSNDAQLTATSCGITVDSSSSNAVGAVGSASVCAQTLGTVSSTWDNSSNINNNGSICSATKIVQGISTQCSPTMPAAPTYSTCVANPVPNGGGVSYSVGPSSSSGTMCYTGLTVGGNGNTVTVNPGIYVIKGGELHFESGTSPGGNGVFFYLTSSANLVIDNGANVNLVAGGNTEAAGGTAPTIGAYNGILFYQDVADTQPMSIQGGSSTFLSGAIYAPSAAITLGNGSGTTVNSDIVALSLTMNGGGTLTSTASANLGTLNISVAKLMQ